MLQIEITIRVKRLYNKAISNHFLLMNYKSLTKKKTSEEAGGGTDLSRSDGNEQNGHKEEKKKNWHLNSVINTVQLSPVYSPKITSQ